MAHSISSSVLQYARFHGIATSYTDVDPLEHVQESCVAVPDLPSNSLFQFRDHINKVHTSFEESLHHEKLDLKRSSALFLASALRRIEPADIESHWESILPSWDRYDKLKVETPILTNDEEKSLPPGARPVCYSPGDLDLSPLEDKISDHDVILARGLANGTDTSGENIREEKLDCAKGALLLIQEARKGFDLRNEDLEDLLRTELGLKKVQASESRSDSPDLLPANDDQFSDEEEPFPTVDGTQSNFGVFAEDEDGGWKNPWTIGETIIDPTHNRLDNTPCVRKKSFQPNWQHFNTSPLIADDIELADYVVTQSKSLEESYELSDHTEQHGFPSHSASQLSKSDAKSSHGISQVAFSEITDNFATSDCIPYNEGVFNINTPPASDAIFRELKVQPQKTRTGCIRMTQVQSNSLELDSTTEEPFMATAVKGAIALTNSPEAVCARERSENMRTEVKTLLESSLESSEIHSGHMPICDAKTSSGNTSLLKSPCLPQKRRSSNCRMPWKRKVLLESAEESFPCNEGRESLHLLTSSNLGSLASFMQVRGLDTKNSVAQTVDFISPALEAKAGERVSAIRLPEEKAFISLDLAQQVLLTPHNLSGGLRLSLSTRLLRSHPDVVRHFEQSELVSSIDYVDPQDHISVNASGTGHSFQHADIIIAFTTALILTNPQATTQLFLPGHKSSIADSAGNINSPLREKVFLLAGNYEVVYILICHGSNPAYNSTSGDLLLHNNILKSLTSFIAFCDSLLSFCSVQSLLIPACPDTIVRWISAIAGKCQA